MCACTKQKVRRKSIRFYLNFEWLFVFAFCSAKAFKFVSNFCYFFWSVSLCRRWNDNSLPEGRGWRERSKPGKWWEPTGRCSRRCLFVRASTHPPWPSRNRWRRLEPVRWASNQQKKSPKCFHLCFFAKISEQ